MPKMTAILPAADQQPATWSYTTNQPPDGWTNPQFDDSSWMHGRSGFGTKGTPGAAVGTTWGTGDIWLRREVVLKMGPHCDGLQAWFHHDEDAEVYINGVLALKDAGYLTSYDAFPLTPESKAALKSGKNLIAIHCHQTFGGQYVDFGLVEAETN
jgi:hypothetical protein